MKKSMRSILKENDNRMDVFSLKDELKYAVPELPVYVDEYVEKARQDLGIERVYEDAKVGRIKVLVLK